MRQIGSFAIVNGTDSGSISWPTLDSMPRRVICSVRKHAGGLNLFANVVDGTLGLTGFTFNLSGQADSPNYTLDYAIFK